MSRQGFNNALAGIFLLVLLIGFAFVCLLTLSIQPAEAAREFDHPGYPGAYEQECCWGPMFDNKVWDECLMRGGRWYRWSPPTLLHLWWDEGHIYRGRDYTVSKSHVCDPSLLPPKPPPTVRQPGPPAENLFDGRINNLQDRDVAAPVAIYNNAGWLDIYDIYGTLLIHVHEATPGFLLGQSGTTALYRLSTGEFQVNASYPDGKPYIFVWGANGKYHLAA